MKPFHQVIVIFENDTDIDSMPDDWGKKYNFNFSDPNDSNKDTDDDNLTNFEEYLNNTDPTNQDSDNDSLTDGDEIKIYFTNPLILDTDGDNYNDNIEIDNGTNPLDETDYPDEDTPNPEENNERKSQEKEYTVFIILGVIIVIILIILGIFMNFKMKKEK